MNAPLKLALFGVGLAAIFGAAASVGSAVGSDDSDDGVDDEGRTDHPTEPAAHTTEPAADHADGHGTPVDVGGLAVAADGYRLVATPDRERFTFTIEDPDGAVVTDFDERHERRLHLIVMSRNFVDYWHLHPEMDADGTWRADLPPLPAGSYRAYADFKPAGGDALTLATDLLVAGELDTVAVPAAGEPSEVDGYTVTLSGEPAVGETTLDFTVTSDGEAVETEPYLGARGHLVVIRGGDLGYLHVHPLDDETVRFAAAFPTPGTYRLFLDFAHAGEVHTAAFTVEVAATAAPAHGH